MLEGLDESDFGGANERWDADDYGSGLGKGDEWDIDEYEDVWDAINGPEPEKSEEQKAEGVEWILEEEPLWELRNKLEEAFKDLLAKKRFRKGLVTALAVAGLSSGTLAAIFSPGMLKEYNRNKIETEFYGENWREEREAGNKISPYADEKYVEMLRDGEEWAKSYLQEKLGIEPGTINEANKNTEYAKQLMVRIHEQICVEDGVDYDKDYIMALREKGFKNRQEQYATELTEAIENSKAVCLGESLREYAVLRAAGFEAYLLNYRCLEKDEEGELVRDEDGHLFGLHHGVCWVNFGENGEELNLADGVVCDPMNEEMIHDAEGELHGCPKLAYCLGTKDYFAGFMQPKAGLRLTEVGLDCYEIEEFAGEQLINIKSRELKGPRLNQILGGTDFDANEYLTR